jgi:hypothetical protein
VPATISFAKTGKPEKFPRDEHVDIVVQPVTLNADAPEGSRVETIEIREFLKEPGVYGHGLVLPRLAARDLHVALGRLLETE